jgi:hypothetical protein
VVTSALRAATHVIALCAPTPVEFERLRVLWPPLEEVGALAEVPPQVAVLLVRTVAGAASTTDYRDVMAGDGSLARRPCGGRSPLGPDGAGWPWANAARPTSRRDAWGSRWPSSARSSRSRLPRCSRTRPGARPRHVHRRADPRRHRGRGAPRLSCAPRDRRRVGPATAVGGRARDRAAAGRAPGGGAARRLTAPRPSAPARCAPGARERGRWAGRDAMTATGPAAAGSPSVGQPAAVSSRRRLPYATCRARRLTQSIGSGYRLDALTTRRSDPGERPLHGPAARNDGGATLVGGLAHEVHGGGQHVPGPVPQASGARGVSEDEPDRRGQVGIRQDRRGAVAVLPACRTHQDGDEQLEGVGDDGRFRPMIFMPVSSPRECLRRCRRPCRSGSLGARHWARRCAPPAGEPAHAAWSGSAR